MICAFFLLCSIIVKKKHLKKNWDKSVWVFRKNVWKVSVLPVTLITSAPLFKGYMDVPELFLAVLYNLNLLLNSQSLWDSKLWTLTLSTSTTSLDVEIPALTRVALFELYCAQESCQTADSQEVWSGIWESVLLTSSQVMLQLLVQRLSLEWQSSSAHWCGFPLWLSRPWVVSGRNPPQFLAP